MNQLNQCIIEGNIVKDAEVKVLSEIEKKVTVFSIAQHRSYHSAEKEVVEEVCFFNVEVWGTGFGDKITPYLKKGVLTRVRGRLKQDVWTDNEGKRHEKFTIVAENIEFNSLSTNKQNATPKEAEVIQPEPDFLDLISVENTSNDKPEKTRKATNKR